jgi:hypothetical protein
MGADIATLNPTTPRAGIAPALSSETIEMVS